MRHLTIPGLIAQSEKLRETSRKLSEDSKLVLTKSREAIARLRQFQPKRMRKCYIVMEVNQHVKKPIKDIGDLEL